MGLVEAAFGVLGSTALRIDGALAARWAPAKPRAMLAALLVAPGATVSTAALVRWVWGDDERKPGNTTATLDVYATRIRGLLKRLPVRASLRGDRGSYHLDTEPSAIDLVQFRELSAAARLHSGRGDPARAARHAESALRLSRGKPLADLRSPDALAWRARFERAELIPAHSTHLTALVELGRADEALALLEVVQAEYHDSLALHKLRLTVLHALHRPEEANEYYLAVRRSLDADGDPETADHLLRHHESLVHALPHPPKRSRRDTTEFVGRGGELALLDAAALTEDGTPPRGVVVLEGMPGVGKTALAVHWGRRVRGLFPGGDLFVDLAGHRTHPAASPAAIVDELLAGLGEEPNSSATPVVRAAALRRVLATRHPLVLLDNAHSAAQVKAVLPLLTECLVVVTSRHSLTELGAGPTTRFVHIGPLAPAESGALLDVRVGGAEAHPDLRAEVIRLCGGLPLAIAVVGRNIAEYRLRRRQSGLSPRRLLLELGIDADSDTSPQTLFTWSYRALPPQARDLFRALGLHPGSEFTAAAARACWGRTEAETAGTLSTLVDANLVDRGTTPGRFRFHDLIRECAHHLTHNEDTPDHRDATERRILAYYLGSAIAAHDALYPGHSSGPPLPPEPLVVPHRFPDAESARGWFAAEHVNLMATTVFAARAGHHAYAWRLPHAVSRYLRRSGHHEDCRIAREIAVDSARADGEPEAEASSLADLGLTYLTLGRFADAERSLLGALAFADATGTARGQGVIRYQLGKLAAQLGDTERAVRLLEESLVFAERGQDEQGKRWTLHALGDALLSAGRHNEALTALREAERLAVAGGDESARASVLAGICAVWRARGRFPEAAAYGEAALRTAEAARDAVIVVTTLAALAEVEHARGALATAEALTRRAVALADRVHHLPEHAKALDLLGDILAGQGRTPQAHTAWRDAAALYALMGDSTHQHEVLAKLPRT
ncbi:SARP family transcriptional regulator [Actinokineospora globicatena]|uniref:SARP family transcriptional regulator n=1 Tax=Actinokineospora globicatena TaxID=103729 RepID=A0A9W6VBS4_9PSEU|nr:SARP family transcriptional regulator [Actinokineospora globicatena]